MNNYKLFQKHLNAEDTDCSFVFKSPTDSSAQFIHAHKLILSCASPYFEANFKTEWKGDKPIVVTVCKYLIFKRLIRAIYKGEVLFDTLEEARELYEAAHFYQTEEVLDLLRTKMIDACQSDPCESEYDAIGEFSKIVNTALKYQDIALMQFSNKYFSANVNVYIMIEVDIAFLSFSPESINFLFQINNLNVDEMDMLRALEKYLESHESVTKKDLKPAIGTIRFLSLPKDVIEETTLLSEVEKDSLLGNNTLNFAYLSKNRNMRKRKPILVV